MKQDLRNRGMSPVNPPVNPPGTLVPRQEVMLPQPPIQGVICPCCGRGMVPRKTGVKPGRTYAECVLCGGKMVFTGKWVRAL